MYKQVYCCATYCIIQCTHRATSMFAVTVLAICMYTRWLYTLSSRSARNMVISLNKNYNYLKGLCLSLRIPPWKEKNNFCCYLLFYIFWLFINLSKTIPPVLWCFKVSELNADILIKSEFMKDGFWIIDEFYKYQSYWTITVINNLFI